MFVRVIYVFDLARIYDETIKTSNKMNIWRASYLKMKLNPNISPNIVMPSMGLKNSFL